MQLIQKLVLQSFERPGEFIWRRLNGSSENGILDKGCPIPWTTGVVNCMYIVLNLYHWQWTASSTSGSNQAEVFTSGVVPRLVQRVLCKYMQDAIHSGPTAMLDQADAAGAAASVIRCFWARRRSGRPLPLTSTQRDVFQFLDRIQVECIRPLVGLVTEQLLVASSDVSLQRLLEVLQTMAD